MKEIKALIYSDLYRYTKSDKTIDLLKSLALIPGFRYTFFWRLLTSENLIIRIFAEFFHLITSIMYNYQIGKKTKIGKGLYIGHFGSIIINNEAIIGDNCNLSPGITIGQTNRGKMQGVPTIGNRVWIGTNAILVGNIQIADNVLIAPGAYVNIDVPSNSIVIGNPAKIITKDSHIDVVEGYVHNRV